jgi:hypothetical protein
MKHKVAELEDALLDAAVAKAEGQLAPIPSSWNAAERGEWTWVDGMNLAYSSDWADGGPIIERERIDVAYWGRKTQEPWRAGIGIAADSDVWDTDTAMKGATPLIAAMRAYVASKFGEEIELP